MLNEDLLEAYAREPERLPAEVVSALEEQLARDEALRSYVDFLRTFYAELVVTRDRLPSKLEALVNHVFAEEAVVPLWPYGAGKARGVPVLSAAGATPAAKRYEVLCTLASTQQRILVRILHDTATGRCQLYTVSKDPGLRMFALFAVPPIGLLLLTDEKGRAGFGMSAGVAAYDWNSSEAVLRLPVGELTVRTAQLQAAQQGTSPHRLERHVFGAHLVIRLDGLLLSVELPDDAVAPDPIRYLSLSCDESDARIAEVRKGEASFVLDPGAEALTLRLYH